MAHPTPPPADDPPQPVPAVDAFVELISSLTARLAAASGDAVTREVDAGLQRLLAFFAVDQCGILEVQPDIRQARLRHVAHLPGVQRAPPHLDYGSLFPWTHERSVIRGETVVQRRVADLPSEAVVDRASCAALRLACIVSVPVGIGGRVSHVLCLTHSRPTGDWPAPILAWLRTVAQTFLAVLARHRSELALQHSERSLAEAQRIAGLGSYEQDGTDGTLLVSDEARRILGLAPGDAIRDPLDMVHADDHARVDDALRRALAERRPACELEYRIVRADGEVRTVRSSYAATYASDGTPLRTVATIHDISGLRAAEQEARRLRAQLRHTDRAAHLGALVASLSHELNQPLTGILANAQAGLMLLPEAAARGHGELREILEAIVRDDRRAAAVVANLRSLLRREEPPRAPFDLGEAVAEVLALLRGEIAAREVVVEADLPPGWIVVAERTQIQQVVLNLLSNAIHAVASRSAGDRRIAVVLRPDGSARAEVAVRDNGCGLPADRPDRIFEPFHTTRPDGLGMGLAVSRSIVDAHGGEIVAADNADRGATVRFALPASSAPPPSAPVVPDRAAGAQPQHAHAPSVCIVDDDPGSREGIARLLQGAGWTVAAFGSPAEALADPALGTAQCLLLDVQMPGMSGLALHARLAANGVRLPTVFLSARSDAATGVAAMKQGAIEYLTKPVDEAALLAAVRSAVRRHADAVRAAREREGLGARLATLTPRERDVMLCVIRGRLNKQIAADLAIAEATVKQHRGRVMEKLQARSVAELVRMCQSAGIAGDA